MAENQLTGELVRVLESAGCSDPGGVALLATAGLAPSQALNDLRRRFPAAFPKHASRMTPEQYKQACAEATRYSPEPLTVIDKHARDMTPAEYTATLRQFGVYRRPPR